MASFAGDEQVQRILEDCYAAIGDARVPDLERLCGGDVELMARVEMLLARERDGVRAACSDRLARVPPFAMPARIAEFTLLEPLGLGGMSRVYRARQEPLGREVALKVMREELEATPAGRLRFQREATITAALDHPNIVPVYAAGEADGHVYLAMKLLRGQSLDRLPKPLAPRDAARYAAEVARALQSAHDVGVVHRDVKPANVLVEKGVAYVVDFGLSSFVHSAGTITRPESTPGTLIYLAPELVRRRGVGLDPRVDVYGLGAILYEALAGQPPFDASNPMRALHQILYRDPPPIRLRGRDRDLEAIVQRAMEKEPARRFQTAGDLAAELQRWLDGQPVQSRPLGPFARTLRAVRRRPGQAAWIAGTAAMALVLTGTWWRQAIANEARRNQAIAAVTAALAAGDTARVATQIEELSAFDGTADPLPALRRALAFEGAVQALMAMMWSPITHQDPRVLQELVVQLDGDPQAIAQSRRAEVALAFASRLSAREPVAHRALTAATMAAWPRTTEALRAWSQGRSPREALTGLAVAGEPNDHLFAALAMRLQDCPTAEVELELRAATATGAEAEAIQYALAWMPEAAGQIPTPHARVAWRAAYDVCAALRESPIYACLAEYHCARLAAKLGDLDVARRHLALADGHAAASPHLRNVARLSSLETLLELDVDTFWRRWRELRAACEHLPQFWLLAGYAEAADADDPTPDSAARVRAHFEQGLAAGPQPASRAALELALLQLEGSHVAAASVERALELGRRAEAFVASVATLALAQDLRAEAWLVAAMAWFAADERARGWQALELACRTGGDPAALAVYAGLVGERILQLHVDADGTLRVYDAAADDFDADVASPLDEAANRAMLRAHSIVAAAPSSALDAHVLRDARIGLFVSAFHLGEPGLALPLACELHRTDPDDVGPPLRALVECCLADGGLRMAQWLPVGRPVSVRVARLLAEACGTMGDLYHRGSLSADRVRASLQRWNDSPTLTATRTSREPAWIDVWQRVAALRASLDGD